MYDVAVAGGGPAGLAAALAAAAPGRRVALFEKQKKIGRRLAVTGNGRGNVGNVSVSAADYNEQAADLLRHMPGALDRLELQRLLASYGILTSPDEAGRLYPVSRQAASLVWTMLDLLAERRVELHTEEALVSFVRTSPAPGAPFALRTDRATYTAKTLVLAVGGQAQPQLGGGDSFARLLAPHGYRLTETSPALAPLLTDARLATADGVRAVAGGCLLKPDGTPLMASRGEFQLTATGVSGIAAMRLAGAVHMNKAPLRLQLDWLPDRSEADVAAWLKQVRAIQPAREARYLLDSLLPQKLAILLAEAIVQKGRNKDVSDAVIGRLSKEVKTTELRVVGTADWRQAQVMRGGVALSEVDPGTLASRRQPGLFLAGEMLDVDGDTGGYNLHWAFLSGHTAGRAAAAFSRAV